jgi:hypothetical protein
MVWLGFSFLLPCYVEREYAKNVPIRLGKHSLLFLSITIIIVDWSHKN